MTADEQTPVPTLTAGEVAATGPAVAQPEPRRGRSVPEVAALVLFLVGEIVFFAIKSPYFLERDNWFNILTAIAIFGIIAAPATLLLVAGQFDLSVGSGTAFCGVIMAYIAGNQAGSLDKATWLGVVLVLLAGLGIGTINGFFVTVVGVNALITTLGMLAVLRGLAQVIAEGQTLFLGTFSGLGQGRIAGSPFDVPVSAVILVGVLALFWFVMRYTVYGRSMYAIGANPVAARLSGVRSKRLIFFGFLLSGLCTAIGGLILVSEVGAAASGTAALGYELQVVTAVILGGASLSGGKGRVLGALIGVAFMALVNNALIITRVSSYWQSIVVGVILVLAVAFDSYQNRSGDS
jgi:ribose transport system permease protein